jgi:hypothetical protein
MCKLYLISCVKKLNEMKKMMEIRSSLFILLFIEYKDKICNFRIIFTEEKQLT